MMNKQRIEQIMEKVTKRNLANVLCGNKTSEVDNEILELLNEVTRLTNNWNELEEWLKSYIALFENPDTLEEQTLEDLKEILDKMKEINDNN